MKKNSTKTVLMLAIMFNILFSTTLFEKTVFAQPNRITGLRQVYATAGTVQIEWDSLPGYDDGYYFVETSYDKINWEYAGTSFDNNGFIADGFEPSTIVYIRVEAVEGESTVAESDILTTTTAPAKVQELKQTDATNSSITINWQASNGATSYQIKGFADGKSQYIGETSSTSYTIKNINKSINGWRYIYIVPIRNIGSYSAIYDDFSGNKNGFAYLDKDEGQIRLIPETINSIKLKFSQYDSKTISFVFEKPKYSTNIEYALYTYKNKKVRTGTLRVYEDEEFSDIMSIDFSKLKSSFYTIKIRSYTYVNGNKLYSEWFSGNFAFQPKMKGKQIGNKIKISWNKVSGATKYEIYMSDRKSGYKKIKTTKKCAIQIFKFNNKGLKKGKRYYIYVIAVGKVGKNTFKSYNNLKYSLDYK